MIELGATLQGFKGNIEVVGNVCETVASCLSDRSSELPGFQQLISIISDCKPILENCQAFLQRHANIIQKRGLGANLKFHIKDGREDLVELRSRILSINSQLNTSILTINL